MRSRRIRPFLAALIAVSLGTAFLATPGSAQVAHSTADYGGYATGTVLHADALEGAVSGDTIRLADAEVSMSGASVASKGLGAAVTNEMDRVVQPAIAGKSAYGRGSGVEVGLAHGPSDPNQAIIAGLAEASAAPSGDMVTKELGPVPADPLLYASLARGQAQARWDANVCTAGSDIAYGLGYAADVQLLDTQNLIDQEVPDTSPLASLEKALLGTDAPDPQRAVAQSMSHLRLVPQVSKTGAKEGDNFGLMSETRMTILPVTLDLSGLDAGLPFLTIEFLGEWVLRAVATGHSGYVTFTPGAVDTSPSTTVLRVIDQTANEILGELKLQDILGATGLQIPIPQLGIEIAVGEAPRAIGGAYGSAPTETATLASGAIDVVRVKLLDIPGTVSLADIRLGHMEALARVPAGGIKCDIPVSKSAPATVTAGDPFDYTITVNNPFDCQLTGVKLEDTITADDGVKFSVKTPPPSGATLSGNKVTWNDIGPIAPHQSASVTLPMLTDPTSGPGKITDTAVATAVCAVGSADGSASVQVPVSGQATISVPEVKPAAAVAGLTVSNDRALPRTGGPLLGGLGLLLASFGFLRRRLHA